MHVEGLHFRQAVEVLMDYVGSHQDEDILAPEDKHKEFRLPPKNNNCDRVISYLAETRGIPYDILRPYFIEERIYEAKGTHNCIFTGIDHNTGEVRYAFQRSSNANSQIMFETFGSDKKYSFSIPGVDTLVVFESVIDLFSYKSMESGKIYKDAFWLSLGGLSGAALSYTISKWQNLKSIVFCFDNDDAADAAYERHGWTYASDFNVFRHKPMYKDWNDQLLNFGYSFPTPPIPWGVAS
jgi:hypothetical protein